MTSSFMHRSVIISLLLLILLASIGMYACADSDQELTNNTTSKLQRFSPNSELDQSHQNENASTVVGENDDLTSQQADEDKILFAHILDNVRGTASQTSTSGHALNLIEDGKYQDAADILEKALQTDHNNPLALYYRAIALAGLGSYSEAEDTFTKYLKNSPSTWYQDNTILGWLLYGKGEYQSAKDTYIQTDTRYRDSELSAAISRKLGEPVSTDTVTNSADCECISSIASARSEIGAINPVDPDKGLSYVRDYLISQKITDPKRIGAGRPAEVQGKTYYVYPLADRTGKEQNSYAVYHLHTLNDLDWITVQSCGRDGSFTSKAINSTDIPAFVSNSTEEISPTAEALKDMQKEVTPTPSPTLGPSLPGPDYTPYYPGGATVHIKNNIAYDCKIVWTPVGSKKPTFVVSIPNNQARTVTVPAGTYDMYVHADQWYQAGKVSLNSGDEYELTYYMQGSSSGLGLTPISDSAAPII